MSSRIYAPALTLCVALTAACAGPQTRRQEATAEAPPPAVAAPPAEAPAAPEAAGAAVTSELPAPGDAEVRRAVERIFKGSATVAHGRAPHFVVGDFNGDGSQDLAVAVSPAPGRLEEINDELANWIIKDPFAPAGAASYGAARRRALAEEGDALLAVIHGYEAEGWRDARATQTYVLKEAAGEGMKARARKAALASGTRAKLPRLRGDVIDESVAGRAGFLYYDGAHYAWYDPRAYTPTPPARIVHGGAVKAVRR